MITRPQLPPKKGYVEVVDDNGEHVYKAVEDEDTALALQLLADHEERLCLIELGVNE